MGGDLFEVLIELLSICDRKRPHFHQNPSPWARKIPYSLDDLMFEEAPKAVLIWSGSEDAFDCLIELQINRDVELLLDVRGTPCAHDQAYEQPLVLLVHLSTNFRYEYRPNGASEPLGGPRGVPCAIKCLKLAPEVFAEDPPEHLLDEGICFEIGP